MKENFYLRAVVLAFSLIAHCFAAEQDPTQAFYDYARAGNSAEMNQALATNPNPEVMSWLFCEIPTNSKVLASVNYMLASPRYNAFRPDQDAVDYVFKSAAGAGNIGLMEALLSMPVLRPNPNKAFAAAAEVGDIMIMSFVHRYSIENQIENQDGADNAFYNAATHKKDDVAMYLLTGQNGFPTPSVKMMARVLQLDPEIVSAEVLAYMRQHHAEDIAAEKNRQVVAKAEAQRQFEATQRLRLEAEQARKSALEAEEQARERALEEERKKFSPEDDALYNKVNTQLQSILAEQRRAYLNSPDKRYKGYTIEEQIMAYGNNSVIPLSLRDEVYNLLTRQLKQRIINAPEILTSGNYIAAANDLVKWTTDKIRTAGLDINTDEVIAGIRYTGSKANISEEYHRDLFNTVWALRAMSVKYDATGTPTEKEEMNSLLVQSFSMIIDHNGRCAQGANGRNFLMQVAMLQFFKTMGNS